ncbi:hypothetical protein BMS3Abin03_01111 [bacterium BMS3Abin03]|nr:hypothetical protein BMS3Abin03_01111 [bacterium BMS3Abin03]
MPPNKLLNPSRGEMFVIKNPCSGEIFYGLSKNFPLIIDEPDLKKIIRWRSGYSVFTF